MTTPSQRAPILYRCRRFINDLRTYLLILLLLELAIEPNGSLHKPIMLCCVGDLI